MLVVFCHFGSIPPCILERLICDAPLGQVFWLPSAFTSASKTDVGALTLSLTMAVAAGPFLAMLRPAVRIPSALNAIMRRGAALGPCAFRLRAIPLPFTSYQSAGPEGPSNRDIMAEFAPHGPTLARSRPTEEDDATALKVDCLLRATLAPLVACLFGRSVSGGLCQTSTRTEVHVARRGLGGTARNVCNPPRICWGCGADEQFHATRNTGAADLGAQLTLQPLARTHHRGSYRQSSVFDPQHPLLLALSQSHSHTLTQTHRRRRPRANLQPCLTHLLLDFFKVR